MTNYAHGQAAETAASTYLELRGYSIVDRNWRTKWCEIDIVAQKDDVIFFVEVKYRLNNNHGTGLDYITAKKLSQMERAATSWIQAHDWSGDYELTTIDVRGSDYNIATITCVMILANES